MVDEYCIFELNALQTLYITCYGLLFSKIIIKYNLVFVMNGKHYAYKKLYTNDNEDLLKQET